MHTVGKRLAHQHREFAGYINFLVRQRSGRSIPQDRISGDPAPDILRRIPVCVYPVFLRPLAFILPLTYGVDILKGAINGEAILPLWVSFPALLLFAAGLFLFSLRNIKRKWVL